MILKRTIKLLKEYLRMNNLELTDVNKYRLDEINKIKEYFDNEIKEKKGIIKKLNKYIVSFDYLDKIFITLSASQATVVGIPVGIAGSSLTLIFTIGTGLNKLLLRVTKKRKYTKSINPKIVRNRQNRSMTQSNCATCGSKKSRFIKEQQAMGLLSNLGIRTPLSKVPLLNVLF